MADSIKQSVDDISASVEEINNDVDVITKQTVETEQDASNAIDTLNTVLKIAGFAIVLTTLATIASKVLRK